eukprot:4098845-Pyramimonas_sp.AAC.1
MRLKRNSMHSSRKPRLVMQGPTSPATLLILIVQIPVLMLQCTVMAVRWLVVVLSVPVAAAAAESQPMLLNLMPVRC